MRVEIRSLQKSLSITAVYVTHDRVEAMSLSDRIVVMNKGKIAQIGTPSEIYRNPASQFVAGFVGKVAFFPCKVLNATGGHCSVEIRGQRFDVPKWSAELGENDNGVVMCRPESLSLDAPGVGIEDGVVATNIYLGNSVESWVKTEQGEVLVQIDNPDVKKIHEEGESVSLTFEPNLAKVLKD
jgi:iron(III) transport system ATP-binding protein